MIGIYFDRPIEIISVACQVSSVLKHPLKCKSVRTYVNNIEHLQVDTYNTRRHYNSGPY